MELDGIPVFVKVVQAGSFSQAARLLGMPNTTVSAKVAALEKRLGVTLIHRTTRKLHVTEAGAAYYQHCIRALEELQAAESELATGKSEPQGVLRITVSVDLGHGLLPYLVKEFLRSHPRMSVDLVVTNRVVDLVTEGVDLAIRPGELEDSTLIAKTFMTVRSGIWASATYLKEHGAPAHPRDLARHDCIVHSEFQGVPIELRNGRERAEVMPKGRVLADDFATIKRFACLGLGIAWLPGLFRDEENVREKLVRVLPKWESLASGKLSFVYPSQRFVSPKVQAFIASAEKTVHSR